MPLPKQIKFEIESNISPVHCSLSRTHHHIDSTEVKLGRRWTIWHVHACIFMPPDAVATWQGSNSQSPPSFPKRPPILSPLQINSLCKKFQFFFFSHSIFQNKSPLFPVLHAMCFVYLTPPQTTWSHSTLLTLPLRSCKSPSSSLFLSLSLSNSSFCRRNGIKVVTDSAVCCCGHLGRWCSTSCTCTIGGLLKPGVSHGWLLVLCHQR